MPDEITNFIKEAKEKGYAIGHRRYKGKTQVNVKFGLSGTTKDQEVKSAKKICRLANKLFGKRVFECLFYYDYIEVSRTYTWVLDVYITNKEQKIKRIDNKIFHVFNYKTTEDRYETI